MLRRKGRKRDGRLRVGYYEGQTGKGAAGTAAKSLQLCLTLCDPIDGSPAGSAIPGILQARTLEWVVISFSRERATSE